MKKRAYCSLIIGFLISNAALAGWTSSGGELLRDKNNPWFVKNTRYVNYCIDIDEENFGISENRANEIIINSVAYWQKGIATANNLIDGIHGFQRFQKTTCNDYVDIRFQFGTLNEAQHKFIKNPQDYVSLAIRTDYDKVNLKAKGFIYISPEKGPLKMSGKDINANIWSETNGKTAELVLAHEMGHVFGYTHNSIIAKSHDMTVGLMSVEFPFLLVTSNDAEDFNLELEKHFPLFTYNGFTSTSSRSIKQPIPCSNCNILIKNKKFIKRNGEDYTRAFLGISEAYNRIQIQIKNNIFVVNASVDDDNNSIKIGEGFLNIFEKLHILSFDHTVFLTKEQKVFKSENNTSDSFGASLILPSNNNIRASINYKSLDGITERKIYFNFINGNVIFTGNFMLDGNNILIPDLIRGTGFVN